MFKFILGISTIVALALCASAFKVESDFNVAGADTNMYIQEWGCTPTGSNPFLNLNDCETCLGGTCVVFTGSNVPSRFEVTPTKTLVNPTFFTTTVFNNMPFQTQETVSGTFPAGQRAVFPRSTPISALAPNGPYNITTAVKSSDDPSTVACFTCVFTKRDP